MTSHRCRQVDCDHEVFATGLCRPHYRSYRKSLRKPAEAVGDKQCSKCRETKPLTEFYRSSDGYGWRGVCKACSLKQTMAWRRANPERSKRNHRRSAAARIARVQGDGFGAIVKADPCSYCGTRASRTIDHIVPRDAGGEDTWENMTGACLPCNSSKATRSLLGYLLTEKIRVEREMLTDEMRLLYSARAA